MPATLQELPLTEGLEVRCVKSYSPYYTSGADYNVEELPNGLKGIRDNDGTFVSKTGSLFEILNEPYNIHVYDAHNTDRFLGTIKTYTPDPSATFFLMGVANFEWFWRQLTPLSKFAVLKTHSSLKDLMRCPEFSLPE